MMTRHHHQPGGRVQKQPEKMRAGRRDGFEDVVRNFKSVPLIIATSTIIFIIILISHFTHHSLVATIIRQGTLLLAEQAARFQYSLDARMNR
jgi:hypothetical protein